MRTVRILLQSLLEFLTFYWVTATGRWMLGQAVSTRPGQLQAQGGPARWLSHDSTYFVAGLFVWVGVLAFATLLWVYSFSPVALVHLGNFDSLN
jgi:hypothetical protein